MEDIQPHIIEPCWAEADIKQQWDEQRFDEQLCMGVPMGDLCRHLCSKPLRAGAIFLPLMGLLGSSHTAPLPIAHQSPLPANSPDFPQPEHLLKLVPMVRVRPAGSNQPGLLAHAAASHKLRLLCSSRDRGPLLKPRRHRYTALRHRGDVREDVPFNGARDHSTHGEQEVRVPPTQTSDSTALRKVGQGG